MVLQVGPAAGRALGASQRLFPMSVQVGISQGSQDMPPRDVHPLHLTAGSPEVKF